MATATADIDTIKQNIAYWEREVKKTEQNHIEFPIAYRRAKLMYLCHAHKCLDQWWTRFDAYFRARR
jgi:hypothetical protein